MTRCHLTLLHGGKQESAAVQEARAQACLYPVETRRVKAEPRTDPTPPRAA